ncbi:class I SAM-dependent methyltransferase [Micromonospora sp. NIE79]|uniref:Class I SAM-dependent methyltransferase n=1 Tax=Micromonospora trifolii TaxID=2911208 RepID=A0ABS9NBE5_9ACTN|nr:class I SAM-dependent methyltransferase [Micromonospora trifolii]MCG5447286.1 class I SAM-dependent methyltransferase [Micromonospora trifolii]
MDSLLDGAIRINDIEVRAHGGLSTPENLEDGVIYIHKDADFIERENAVLDRAHTRRMVEIGLLHGGDAIYWTERHQLERLCAIDIEKTPSLADYIKRNSLEDRIRLHSGVSQDDHAALSAIIAEDFDGEPIDAVIDDASHFYGETRATFESVFPFLRPGGAYIIEDWAWGHTHDWPEELMAELPLMSPLLSELMLIVAHMTDVIRSIEVDRNFAVVWRGDHSLPTDGSFRLADHMRTRGFTIAL